MIKRHNCDSGESGAERVLGAIAGSAWESPRVVRYAADDLDRGSLRILAGETPIDEKPGGDGGDDDAAY